MDCSLVDRSRGSCSNIDFSDECNVRLELVKECVTGVVFVVTSAFCAVWVLSMVMVV